MEERIYYIKEKKVLAFYKQQANSYFWDQHWQTENIAASIRGCIDDGIFISRIKKFLPEGSVVLEGGCGQGYIVHAMHVNGYKAIGIDFAVKTTIAIQKAVPELDVRYGNVMNLSFDNNSLDGYVSGGVIEHFWDGYESIISEMARTIKPGGYLFITFPFMSFLRRLKVLIHCYPNRKVEELEEEKATFYQFALNPSETIKTIEANGFRIIEKRPMDGIKGFKDEFTPLRSYFQKVYDGKKHNRLRSKYDSVLRLFAGHILLLVFRKK